MFKKSIGKTIQSAALVNNSLHLRFTDGALTRIYDDGQSCCETRYMHTDDDLLHYTGATLLGAELREVTNEDEDYECKDCQFLAILTSKGNFTIANYNIHDGHYGGFDIIAAED